MMMFKKRPKPTAATKNAADEVVDCEYLRCSRQTSGFHEGDLKKRSSTTIAMLNVSTQTKNDVAALTKQIYGCYKRYRLIIIENQKIFAPRDFLFNPPP